MNPTSAPHVFISYSRRNLDFVQQLVHALKQKGKDPWFDQLKEPLSGIAAGAPWWKQIQTGIEEVDNFLFVISPDSISSPYCHAEINYAREHGKRLVPLLYCGDVGKSETYKAIDAAIEAIPDDEEMPDSVISTIRNLKNLARENWGKISDIQFVAFTMSTPFEQSIEELLQALDLDFAWVRLHSQLTQSAKLWEANNFDDDYLWGANRLKPVHDMIARRKPELDTLVQQFIEPEQERLLREIENPNTTHQRRRDIGDRLGVIGDTRLGVGVKDGIPDILWLPVNPGGEIKIENTTFKVQSFYIAKYQVTHVQFQAFVEAEDGFKKSDWWQGMPNGFPHHTLTTQFIKAVNNPRDSISWYQAVAFCRWLDTKLPTARFTSVEKLAVRLPTEWEWRWAAQAGYGQWRYPWGEWKEGYSNTSEAGLGRAIGVGMYPHGVAVCGALDMVGNLWEWCLNDNEKIQDISLDNGQYKTIQGGSFFSNELHAISSFRNSAKPIIGDSSFGFRIVLAPPIPGL
ncbi:MAG: SUMF1/EgtB/PvdO family nonheme iron enzyme [Anaerolineae bacterium]